MYHFCCEYGIVRLPEIVFAGPVDPCPDHDHEGDGHNHAYLIGLTMLVGHERCYEKLSFPGRNVRDATFEDLLVAMRRFIVETSPDEEGVPDGDDT